MSLKVGQPAAASAATAATRQVALQHTAPTGLFPSVGELSMSNFVRPEDESMHFGEGWDELQFQRRQRQQRREAEERRLSSVRFGDILTTQDVSATLINYRSSHDVSFTPPMKRGVMIYENALRAISTAGETRPPSSHANWIL